MAKLCPEGKAAAKKKFKVYPSAYANMYASAVCKGKVGRKKMSTGGPTKKLFTKGCGAIMKGKRKAYKNV